MQNDFEKWDKWLILLLFMTNYALHLMLFLDTKYSVFQNIPMIFNKSQFIYHWKYDKYVVDFVTSTIVELLDI